MHRESTFLKRLADLSPTKQALLEKRLRDERQQERDRTTDIPRRAQEKAAPLSFAQQRLWFMQQWEPESAVYNEVVAIRLNGPLHVEALTQAVREIVHRHEVLRSTYPTIDGQAQQVIDPSLHESLTIDLIDLREVPAGEREAETQRRIAWEVQRPFHLEQEIPWRRLLLRLDEEEHIALTVMHHIITDAWSMEVFVGELTTLYAAFSTGEASPLPQTPLQYADYACWQQQRLEEGKLERQRAYWKGQLGGTLPVLELPTDTPRPVVQTFHGRRHPVVINRSLSQALQALGRREGATVFMTLLAAFKVLLYRYSEQEDVLVGTTIANRTRPELERLLGCFVNTLALRTNLSGNPAFRDLLQRVREVTLGAYEHQDIPFEKVVEDVQVARSLRHATLCQVMFELQNVPLAEQELAGLTLRPVEVEHTTAKFELSLCLRESVQGLSGYLEYNTDLFEVSTIERFVGHFLTVLEAVVADPGQRIADLPLLTGAELQQMLVDWNATAALYSHESCFHRLFEEQVKRTPEAVAV
ncbi:MAG: condensation domain-containing protein, partial [Ktedonobacteraceae bacterium]